MSAIKFMCKMRKGKQVEEWPATITRIADHGGYFEMHISSRSGIDVVFGGTQRGGFCCVPDWKAGCELAGYTDIFWNLERITASMKKNDKVDAVTVAYAIAAVGELLDGNGRLQIAQ